MAAKKTNPAKPRVSAIAAAVAAADADEGRSPQFDEGDHIAQFKCLRELDVIAGKDPYMHAVFDLDGVETIALHCVSQKALAVTAPRLKALAMALVGCPTVEEYNEFDPHGEFIDALLGFENRFTTAPEGEGNVADYVGKDVKVCCTLGGEAKDGSRYRNTTYKAAEVAG